MSRLDETLPKDIPPFRRLARAQIREILDLAAPRRHEEGGAVFREGEEAKRFYLLLDGYIRVVRTTSGGKQIIALHIPSGQPPIPCASTSR